MSELSVRALVETAKEMATDAFSARFGPLLLLGPPAEQSPGDGHIWRFVTEPGTRPLSFNPLGQFLDARVYPLRKKSESDAFSGVVLVGRSESNDVWIAHPSVSKLHARIDRQDGRLLLTDANSTNGTFYDERPVRAGKAVELQASHRVRFGDIQLTIYDPARLHGMLQSVKVF